MTNINLPGDSERTPDAVRAYRVLDMTQRYAEAFNMGEWANRLPGNHTPVSLPDLTAEHPCGTSACFAGWTVALEGYEISPLNGRITSGDRAGENAEDVAADLLGINPLDLFFVSEEDVPATVRELFGPRPAVTE